MAFFKKNKKQESDLAGDLDRKEKENKQKMFEIEILNELGGRIDYSLDVQNIINIITESLGDLLDYTFVSSMLLFPEKIIFKGTLQKPVSYNFIEEIKTEMLNSMSALLNADLKNLKIEETLFGAAVNEEADKPVGSFFNIPLVISEKVAGLLTVADTRAGFYSQEEMSALYNIAQQATQAVTRLQKVVESENSKMNAMVSSMTDGVVMTDMDNRITVVNPAARRALGFENKNDLSVSDFAAGLSKNFDLKDKIEESLRLDKIFLSEEISLPAGFFKVIVSPVKDKWRKLGCAIVFRDMTREKEVERIKEDFTSMIVHELRSPLDSIKKMTELMRKSEVTKAKREECFQMIYSSSSEMLELINNLLDIAKIEAGKFELLKQPSDIKKIIESRILFFAVSAKDANVKITSCFGKDIPENVEFDPHTISQVLNNLLSNAIKFTKENGSIVVQCLFHKNGESLLKEAKDAGINWFIKKDIQDIPDSLLVAVTDNGVGIAEDQINRLFNKFVQAKSTFVEKGGTGLGLAITKSIVDSHGGIVGAESIEGKGTTFYFTLPINATNN
ncbi:MAG: ATP-binding protein [Candidatus Staskawiczbacteria bacterium]|jgi:signal transduction histidine kinase